MLTWHTRIGSLQQNVRSGGWEDALGDYRLNDGGWPNWLKRANVGIASRTARVNRYRSIWISDIHLGTRVCKAEALLAFLRHHQADNLYLVGDIVDGWNLGASWYWTPAQAAVCGEIAAWSRRGARVVFLPAVVPQIGGDGVAVPASDRRLHRRYPVFYAYRRLFRRQTRPGQYQRSALSEGYRWSSSATQGQWCMSATIPTGSRSTRWEWCCGRSRRSPLEWRRCSSRVS